MSVHVHAPAVGIKTDCGPVGAGCSRLATGCSRSVAEGWSDMITSAIPKRG